MLARFPRLLWSFHIGETKRHSFPAPNHRTDKLLLFKITFPPSSTHNWFSESPTRDLIYLLLNVSGHVCVHSGDIKMQNYKYKLIDSYSTDYDKWDYTQRPHRQPIVKSTILASVHFFKRLQLHVSGLHEFWLNLYFVGCNIYGKCSGVFWARMICNIECWMSAESRCQCWYTQTRVVSGPDTSGAQWTFSISVTTGGSSSEEFSWAGWTLDFNPYTCMPIQNSPIGW